MMITAPPSFPLGVEVELRLPAEMVGAMTATTITVTATACVVPASLENVVSGKDAARADESERTVATFLHHCFTTLPSSISNARAAPRRVAVTRVTPSSLRVVIPRDAAAVAPLPTYCALQIQIRAGSATAEVSTTAFQTYSGEMRRTELDLADKRETPNRLNGLVDVEGKDLPVFTSSQDGQYNLVYAEFASLMGAARDPTVVARLVGSDDVVLSMDKDNFVESTIYIHNDGGVWFRPIKVYQRHSLRLVVARAGFKPFVSDAFHVYARVKRSSSTLDSAKAAKRVRKLASPAKTRDQIAKKRLRIQCLEAEIAELEKHLDVLEGESGGEAVQQKRSTRRRLSPATTTPATTPATTPKLKPSSKRAPPKLDATSSSTSGVSSGDDDDDDEDYVEEDDDEDDDDDEGEGEEDLGMEDAFPGLPDSANSVLPETNVGDVEEGATADADSAELDFEDQAGRVAPTHNGRSLGLALGLAPMPRPTASGASGGVDDHEPRRSSLFLLVPSNEEEPELQQAV